MFSNELMERFHEIVSLQEKCISLFGENDYNVFIFGSYLTERYVPGRSDIDIAIYADDYKKYLDIALFFEEYFTAKGIKQDIFSIDFDIPSPIYCVPLNSPCRFTDYYPNKLEEFKEKCEEKNQRNKEILYANQRRNLETVKHAI